MFDKKLRPQLLRIGMEIADITVQELSYDTDIPVWVIYNCRSMCNKREASDGVWSVLFYALEKRAPGTQRLLREVEESKNVKQKRIFG